MSTFQCATAPNMVFNSREELHQHYKSEWHRYNLRRRAAGLAPITKDVFDKVRALAASQEKSSEQRVKKQDHLASKHRGEVKPKKHADEEKDFQEESNENLTRRVAKAINTFEFNPNACIWDGRIGESIEDNLDHMHKSHGFLIPDLASVKDLTGLLKYLAEKVHIGQICLLCEREFRSSAACIAHMTTKGHCRIPWEYEDDMEEFLEFYDFSISEAEQDDSSTMEYDSNTGELILTNAEGQVKRLGPSREFKSVYRSVKEEARHEVDPAISNAIKERSLQLYERAGILTTSSALTLAIKKKLNKKANELQSRQERRFHETALQNGMKVNWLIKDRKAGTNVGAGHGVHG